jgi:hypothetical protein
MINQMLKEYLIYDDLNFMPIDKYKNIEEQNKKIIVEIEKMRNKLNHDLYIVANNEFNRIINNIDIPFLRRLMYEQQINFNTYNNDFIDFSIDDDDFNLEQNILLRKLINHNKMRNLIKFFVLKKYFRLNNNDYEKNTLIIKLIDRISKTDEIDSKDKYLAISVLEYLGSKKEDFSKRGFSGGGNELNFNNVFMVCIGLYFYDNERIRNLCYEIIRKQNPHDVARGIIERLASVAQSDFKYKILLSPAIIKGTVEDYKLAYSKQLGKVNDQLDRMTFEAFAGMVKPLEANSTLCNPEYVLALATPFYIAKLKMENKSLDDDNIKELLQNVYKPIEGNTELIDALKKAFTTNDKSASFLDDDDDSALFIPECELQQIEAASEASTVTSKKEFEASPIEITPSSSVSADEPTHEEYEPNYEVELGDMNILQTFDLVPTHQLLNLLTKGLKAAAIDSQPYYILENIKKLATSFGYTIGSNKWRDFDVVPRKSKHSTEKFKIFEPNSECFFSSFFLPNGIEVCFFEDKTEEEKNRNIKTKHYAGKILYFFQGRDYITYNEAHRASTLAIEDKNTNKNFPSCDVYHLFTLEWYLMTHCVKYNPVLESDNLSELAANTAHKNGYLIGNKRFGYADIIPIKYTEKNKIGRLGFKFKKNGISVLYTSLGTIIYMSPNNSTEYTTYEEAYFAYDEKIYTGFTKIYADFKKSAKYVGNKFIKYKDRINMIYSFISKLFNNIYAVYGYFKNVGGGILFTIKAAKKYPRVAVAIVGASVFTYYFPEPMAKLISEIFCFLFNYSMSFLKLITWNTLQLTYHIGFNILENISKSTISSITEFYSSTMGALSMGAQPIEVLPMNALHNLTKAILDNIRNITPSAGGSIIQNKKKYYNKYLKYKTKYLALK